jgi:type IX secretion system PorP/SprF family membrane protein
MGAVVISSVAASYAYRIQTTSASDLSFGLSMGATHYGISHHKLHPMEENDPLLQNLANKWKPTINVGVYYGSDIFYAGLSARNITSIKKATIYEPEENYLIPVKSWYAVLTMGAAMPLTDKVEFRPSFMWQEDFFTPSHIDLTAALLFLDRFWIGVAFRTDQHFWKSELPAQINELYSVALVGEVFITDRLTLSYTYDMGLNTFSRHYFGGHELSVGYYLTRKGDSRFNRRLRYKKYAVESVCKLCL